MISGNIGSATLRRLDYTVIGDAVNRYTHAQYAMSNDHRYYRKINYLLCCDRSFHRQTLLPQ
jgi:hypothetical protein